MPGLAISQAPKLAVARRVNKRPEKYNPPSEYGFRYRAKKHQNLPHVVKFSGGRSSGMMLFALLESGLLNADRGDVIVFNNTSAEHPGTYRFVADCMRASQAYGIPFFQTEFQTYEDARKGEWTRLPTYRLVNDQPKSSDNPNGFHWQGEVYEELLSWAGFVPNQFNRICTRHLKLEVTRNFLRDWLASRPSIPRLGHYGDTSRIDLDIAFERHKRNGGGVPQDIFLRKRAYVWSRPHFRPEQRYEEYCPDWKPFQNIALEGKSFGDKAKFGKGGVEYVAMVGLRSDEPHRMQRILDRNEGTEGYEGEHVYMPLGDMAVTRDDVNAFWDSQNWDLSLPNDASMSNCVYCFLKGAANLDLVHARMENEKTTKATGFGQLTSTPCDVSWWARIESEYGRDLLAEGRQTRSNIKHIGFFNKENVSFKALHRGLDLVEYADTMLPCDCTD